MVHVDNEFGPMKPLIDKLKKGPTRTFQILKEKIDYSKNKPEVCGSA